MLFFLWLSLLYTASPCCSLPVKPRYAGGAKMIRGVCMCLQLHYLPLKNVYLSFMVSFSVFLLAAAWLLGCPGKSSDFRQNVLCVLINACDSLFLLVKNGCIVSFCRISPFPHILPGFGRGACFSQCFSMRCILSEYGRGSGKSCKLF